MDCLSIALQAIIIYARTKGIKRETIAIVFNVNGLEQLFANVRELCKSVLEG